MMAGGEELPDLLLNFSIWPEDRDRFGREGYFVDLAPYFEDEEFMANYQWDEDAEKNLSDEMKDKIKLECYDVDGHMYAFPRVMSATFDTPRNVAYINKTWLDKLGLDMPTNLDEMMEVATAFLTQDPNGNGVADEIPILGGTNINKGNILQWIMENYSVGTAYLYGIDANNQIFLPWLEDDYREGLKKLNEFYEAGLLTDLIWTMQSSSELTAITSPADEVAKAGIICTTATTWATNNTPLLYDYVALDPFAGSYALAAPVSLVPSSNFITTDCDNVEAAMDLLLTISTPEGVRRQRYGEPEVDWVWATDYETGMRGLKLLNSEAYTGQTKQTWGQETARLSWYTSVEEEEAGLKDPTPAITIVAEPPEERNWADARTALHRANAYSYLDVTAQCTRPEKLLTFTPIFTDEEYNELGNLEYTLMDYYKEMQPKFIMGDLDVYDDAVWQKYLDDAEKMNASRMREIQQAGYERSMALLEK